MSQFTFLKPILYTRALTDTVKFYTEVLGFVCVAFEEAWGWASLIKDDVEVMFSFPIEHIPFDAPLFTGSFYIVTDKVDELWDAYKDKCKVCYGLENFDYGMREFAVYDNNGYLLQFGQEIK
ncbi:VOC family protein [Flavobacterium sp. AG291]|uniref:VOC family protein n=1 Tax=Flavobacterium sp. AG291 TaxID=2184000 RepID=UPI000E0B2AD2|nr:VOC family protein [Flavobacterium sp. AG291]RDI08178.1 hypothetical protein DEU42_1115 [Flavobacterium sp. AG291]